MELDVILRHLHHHAYQMHGMMKLMPKLYADVIKEAGWCRGVYGAARGVWGARVAHDERDAGAAALSRGWAIWRAPGELPLMVPRESAAMWAGERARAGL